MAATPELVFSIPAEAPSLPAWLLAVPAALLFSWFLYYTNRRYQAQQAQIRSSIAANLHDELGSLLMRMHMQVESMLNQPAAKPAELETLRDHTRAACSAMRDVAWGLDTSADTASALQDRMRDLLDQLKLTSSLSISFHTEGLENVDTLPARLRQEVYLVFKEATTNVLRHAKGATCLAARLYRQKNSLLLEVKDDGQAAVPWGRSGMGLRSMEQRAQAVGGRLEAGARPDGPGFRVSFCAPLLPVPPVTRLARWLR